MKRATTATSPGITSADRLRIMQFPGRSLIACTILCIASAHAWSAESAGTIKTLTGLATVTRDSSVLPIAAGERVFAGDRIASGQGSYVGIMLRDDTRLTVGPGSELLIREFEFNSSSHAGELAVSFLKGTMRVVTGLIGKQSPDRVRFSTPTATIGIRGTEFVVDLETE